MYKCAERGEKCERKEKMKLELSPSNKGREKRIGEEERKRKPMKRQIKEKRKKQERKRQKMVRKKRARTKK